MSAEPKITPELVAKHGLAPEEYARLGSNDGRIVFESIRATLGVLQAA